MDKLTTYAAPADGRLTAAMLADHREASVLILEGSLVIFDGRAPHPGCANTSDRSRHACTFHVIEASSQYPEANWLQRAPDCPLRGFDL